MIVGTGGTTGRPKGVELTGANLETMTAITLMSYPFEGRPVYLALAPLTHAAGVLCFPVLACGGEVVVMRTPDVGAFLALIERHRVTHTFLPPTLIYMALAHERPRRHGSLVAALLLVRRGADVGRAARGGPAPDRPGHGAAVRPDRGAHDDLDAVPARPLPPRRHGRHRAAGLGGPARAAGHGGHHGRRWEAAAARRGRRDRRPRLAGDARLPPGPGRHRGRVRVRLAPHRRHRLPRRRQRAVHRRPGQGHGHHRRLQRVLHRGRADDHAAPRGAGLRRHRPARREVGRTAHRGGAAPSRRHGRRRPR